MNAETFAEWFRRQGINVVRTPSSYWYEASRRVYQAFPYHWVIRPEEEEITALLRKQRAFALRYSTPVSSSFGQISYHAVYSQPDYTLESLDRRSRQNIRTGLKNCTVEPVTLHRLAEEGWQLEMDTAARQGRKLAMSKEAWFCRYLAAADLPGFESWGALVDGRLVASLLTFQMGDCSEFISQQCHHEYLSARVNNALTFVVTQSILNRPEIHSIFYTLQSLDAPPSVDEFKFRMGYFPKPVRQRVAFHPVFAPIANHYTYAIVENLCRRSPDNPFYTKTAGMLRFYLQGKLAIEDQDWPECLLQGKPEILHAQTLRNQDDLKIKTTIKV